MERQSLYRTGPLVSRRSTLTSTRRVAAALRSPYYAVQSMICKSFVSRRTSARTNTAGTIPRMTWRQCPNRRWTIIILDRETLGQWLPGHTRIGGFCCTHWWQPRRRQRPLGRQTTRPPPQDTTGSHCWQRRHEGSGNDLRLSPSRGWLQSMIALR